MMRYLALLFVVIGIITMFSSCKQDKYDIKHYYSESEQDTLMTNIITYIYKTPRGVRKENKHSPEYRYLYVAEVPNFKFVHYYINPEDSIHYFYLIRPARNTQGHKRGVAGKYKTDSNLNLTDFQEIFNTPMLPETDIIEKGKYLWTDLMYYDNVERYLLNKDFIEFPDERTRYDTITKEWTYAKE